MALRRWRCLARALPTPLCRPPLLPRQNVAVLSVASRGAASNSADGDSGPIPRRGRQRGRELGPRPGRGRQSDDAPRASAPSTAVSASSAASGDRGEASAGRRDNAPARGGPPRNIKKEVFAHMEDIQQRSKRVFEDRQGDSIGAVKFQQDWRRAQGHKVPARFRLQDPPPRPPRQELAEGETVAREPSDAERDAQRIARNEELKKYSEKPYADFAGLRFPTLETAESYNYHQDEGLDKLVERSFPITVPGYRRLDPYLREYIHFLNKLDPARFSVSRIAERYRLREKTVARVVQEWSVNRWLTSSGLTSLREKQATKESAILKKKEEMYAKWVGWDQLGDQEDGSEDDEELGEFRGWRPTSDWVRRQKVEVEMMSAFPMMEKRSPMPKRVDVDLTVATHRGHKVINWIDPNDKVVF